MALVVKEATVSNTASGGDLTQSWTTYRQVIELRIGIKERSQGYLPLGYMWDVLAAKCRYPDSGQIPAVSLLEEEPFILEFSLIPAEQGVVSSELHIMCKVEDKLVYYLPANHGQLPQGFCDAVANWHSNRDQLRTAIMDKVRQAVF